MRLILILLLLAPSSICVAQINTFYVQPIQTDLNYASVQDSHLVVRNTTTNLNKLFLFIGGTGSNTKGYQTISNFAGNLGYDVINISYPNTVAAASLANSSDSMVFNKYRQEVCYGTALSPDVTVDTLNCIYTRTVKLINYLNSTYPTQNWNQYLINPTTLDWSRIAIGGHSQGGGHACYFAKLNDVERVLMFSSPNDYSNYFSNAANWLRTSGITAMNKHFAYLNLLDEVVQFNKQLINLEGLGLHPLYDTTHVDITSTPYNNSHCLYTTQTPGIAILYHNTTTKFSLINNSVWTYMLTSTITTSLNEVKNKCVISVYPNPTSSIITIYSDDDFFDEKYNVQNTTGQIILTGKSSNTHFLNIDFATFDNGIYFVTIGKKTVKIIKT
ncbi:MAG: T9SS type A sorting domain-containing protein [Bacteroidia bacterium]|nr:T9SS type A sorting domain-containing protein [Bacteroidia bacterium]